MISPVISELIEWCARRTSIINVKDDIDTVIIGSSHGYFGFNPALRAGSFNLCMTSQDLQHSLQLYLWLRGVCKNVKNIILFYSVFSNGHDMTLSSESWRCSSYKETFSFDIKYPAEIEKTCDVIRGLANIISMPDRKDFGFVPSHRIGFFPESYGAERRAIEHLRCNFRGGQDQHLKAFLKIARLCGHDVTIVIPPARSDYIDFLRRKPRDLFDSLHEIVDSEYNQSCKIINCMGDNDFQDDFFGDFDHLLPFGRGPFLIAEKVAASRP